MRTIRDQRGSTVLISLVLIFIMTILGLALFDLGTVESRVVYTSQTDARVFEIAQAGVQRALQKLVERKNAVLPNGESWATGANVYCTGGTASQHGCSETQFRPADPSFISNLGFDGGTYAIELMQVKPGSPSVPPLSVPCNKDANNICNDLMFVRATGTLTNTPAGYSRTRTIQVLAQPSTNAIFGRGLTGATATGLPINGNVKIAGSIFVTGIDGTGSLQLGGGAGQRNSWAELDATSLSRLAMLPLVCPVGRTCSGPSDLVESLGATLKVAHPTNVVAVSLSGDAKLGQNGDQTYAGDATRKGKGPLDGVYVADGCTMPCTDNFSNVTVNSTVFVDEDNITKPFTGATPPFPLLTDPAYVGNTHYDHFACLQGGSCTPPGTPSTAEFFVSRAANVMGIAAIANSLGSTTGLTDATAAFTASLTFKDQYNNLVNAEICWKRLAPPYDLILEFGIPTCATPAPSSNPLLLYFPSATPATTGFNIQRVGGPTQYSSRGSAIVVTNGLVEIEETWQTCLTTGAGTPCQGHQFSRDSSLAVLTSGAMNLGKSNSNIDRIMGYFYSGGIFSSQKQTNLLGSITGLRLCFAGGTSPCSSGGNVPSFFQVPPDPSTLAGTITFGPGNVFTIGWVPRFWVECKRAPGDTLPSGLCSYTP